MTTEYFLRLIEQAELEEAQRMARVRSRVYGYANGNDGPSILEPEADLIRSTIGQLASIPFLTASKILEDISKDLRTGSPQVRNRSGRLFTPIDLARLASNPIYAALELNSLGMLVRIHNYPAIVTEKEFRTAWARLKRENLA